MTQNSVSKRRRIRFLVAISGAALVLVFFLAPIIPVGLGYRCPLSLPFNRYTDWQSPSYHLFQIGYHYTTQQPVCFGG